MTKKLKAYRQTLKFLKAYNEEVKKGRDNKKIKENAIKALDILFPDENI